jgi:regulator of protease activity HflC (stomatin/prohibitin superfamily)
MKKVLMCSVLMLFLNGCSGCVYIAEMEGRAKLAEAEGSKKIQIEDAKGKLESAKLLSDAEVERAKGVAEANKIIGDSLKNNESYLRYLYIQNLEKAEAAGSSVIYIPTEAGLPILEANRRK